MKKLKNLMKRFLIDEHDLMCPTGMVPYKKIVMVTMVFISSFIYVDANAANMVDASDNKPKIEYNCFYDNIYKTDVIDTINTVNIGMPSRITYLYSPKSKVVIVTEDEYIKNNLDVNIENKELYIKVKGSYDQIQDIYNIDSNNVYIKIYSPEFPKIKTTNRNLWIASTKTKNASTNDNIQ